MISDGSSGAISTRPGRILVAIDGSASSAQAMTYARNIVPSGGQVCIVTVADNPRTLVPTGAATAAYLDSARAELLQDAVAVLGKARDAFARSDVHVETEVIDLSKRSGDVVHALLDIARTWQAELVVVGARQHHGLLRWLEGAVSEPLARQTGCPIIIVPDGCGSVVEHAPRRILFATDGSPPALRAMRFGIRYASADTALRAVYVVDRVVRLTDFVPIDVLENAFVEEGERVLAAAASVLAEVSEHAGTALVHTQRTGDDVSQTIVREATAWRADLIVMGSHGRRGIAGWMLGSVALHVARITRVPLLLVNARET
ncbi:universal stress protein UspA [Burkholderia ubonensis]|uniref:Universal stress protein UspA n=2 Tax=Burkholderia ubonensis TaxID=101571 RepID=A0A125GB34_9BURK|nr:universal stress protein UspA [Burkholderia ubonensis]KWD92244.1 universal stress protein UspA [Burkholderia ubonensis]KWD96273.1 universal stress protein UspA [Burkholderia ubonensis]KWE10573.1 universal stress protein UspA [Burkholderia ubonensis]